MKIINASPVIAVLGLLFLNGCVGYDPVPPYPHYAPPMIGVPHPVPYGGYIAPRPFAGGEFRGHDERGPGREFRDYGAYRRHERD